MGIHEEQLKVKGREIAKEITAEREVLAKELKEKLNLAYKTDAMVTHQRMLDFTNIIRGKYSDYSKYRLWHLLIGSTIGDASKITHFDFPGDLSVEKFIKSLDTIS